MTINKSIIIIIIIAMVEVIIILIKVTLMKWGAWIRVMTNDTTTLIPMNLT